MTEQRILGESGEVRAEFFGVLAQMREQTQDADQSYWKIPVIGKKIEVRQEFVAVKLAVFGLVQEGATLERKQGCSSLRQQCRDCAQVEVEKGAAPEQVDGL